VKKLFKRKTSLPALKEEPRSAGPCLNCGTHLWPNDLYCPKCGQKRLEHEDMSFSRMIGESFLDYFHFDSKFFKTIIPLIFKPGRLTLEYMIGKRKTYVEPFRLFLVISIIYFLLLPLSRDTKYENAKVSQANSTIRQKKSEPNQLKFSANGIPISLEGEDSIKREIDSVGLNRYIEKRYAGENWISKLFMRQIFRIIVYSQHSFYSVLEHTASKMIFLLIPLFALLLKLLYRKSRRLYYEHLIFSLHTHAFIFLVMILVLLIEFLVPVKMVILITVALVYLFLAMKSNYAEKAGRTIRKFLLLVMMYCIIALPIFFFLLFLVSIFMV
jgi:hypothetical protein